VIHAPIPGDSLSTLARIAALEDDNRRLGAAIITLLDRIEALEAAPPIARRRARARARKRSP
jgi:hypothetical protein